MLLDILTPEKLLYEGEIKSVKLPGTNGEFEILNNHAQIISTLSKGEICVTNTNNDKSVTCSLQLVTCNSFGANALIGRRVQPVSAAAAPLSVRRHWRSCPRMRWAPLR